MPKSALSILCSAAATRVPFAYDPSISISGYGDACDKLGQEAAKYEWSGYVMSTVLVYLADKGIDLLHSEHDDVVKTLRDTGASTATILTNAHKQSYLEALSQTFSKSELRDYWRQHHEADDDLGDAMLDGIRTATKALRRVDDTTVVIVDIG